VKKGPKEKGLTKNSPGDQGIVNKGGRLPGEHQGRVNNPRVFQDPQIELKPFLAQKTFKEENKNIIRNYPI